MDPRIQDFTVGVSGDEAESPHNVPDIRQIVFTNICLLGFDSLAMEAQYRIPFNKDMFAVPNKRGFEVVIHFLFDRLDPALAQEEFRNCWPIIDKKAEQQFRRSCTTWITAVAKDPEARFPRIFPSLFLSPGGSKFYQLLLSFSTYVMQKCISTEHGVKLNDYLQYPNLRPHALPLTDAMSKVVMASTVGCRQRFMQHVQQSMNVQGQWRQYAEELVKMDRKLSKRVRELDHEEREAHRYAAELNAKRGSPMPTKRKSIYNAEMDAQLIKRAQRVQKVRSMWKQISNLHEGQHEERSIVQTLLSGADSHEVGLDATNMAVRIPDLLLRECERDVHMGKIDNLYEGGKLNLVSLIQLWNHSLRLYIAKLQQVGGPDFSGEIPGLSVSLRQHQAQLHLLQKLSDHLSQELLPELKDSVDNLATELTDSTIAAASHTPTHLQASSHRFVGDLQVSTPPFEMPHPESPVDFSVTLTSHKVASPIAAENILHSVSKKARQEIHTKPYKSITPGQSKNPKSNPAASDNINDKLNRTSTQRKRTTSKLPLKRHLVGLSDVSHGSDNKQFNQQDSLCLNLTLQRNVNNSRVVQDMKDLFQDASSPARDKKASLSPAPLVNAHNVLMSEAVSPVHSQRASPAGTPLLKAHNILADRIVSAVISGAHSPAMQSHIYTRSDDSQSDTSSNNGDVNVIDPLAALDDGVFQTKELLVRSPADQNGSFTDKRLKSDDQFTEKINNYSVPVSQLFPSTESEKKGSDKNMSANASFSSTSSYIPPSHLSPESSHARSPAQNMPPVRIERHYSGRLAKTISPFDYKQTGHVAQIASPFAISSQLNQSLEDLNIGVGTLEIHDTKIIIGQTDDGYLINSSDHKSVLNTPSSPHKHGQINDYYLDKSVSASAGKSVSTQDILEEIFDTNTPSLPTRNRSYQKALEITPLSNSFVSNATHNSLSVASPTCIDSKVALELSPLVRDISALRRNELSIQNNGSFSNEPTGSDEQEFIIHQHLSSLATNISSHASINRPSSARKTRLYQATHSSPGISTRNKSLIENQSSPRTVINQGNVSNPALQSNVLMDNLSSPFSARKHVLPFVESTQHPLTSDNIYAQRSERSQAQSPLLLFTPVDKSAGLPKPVINWSSPVHLLKPQQSASPRSYLTNGLIKGSFPSTSNSQAHILSKPSRSRNPDNKNQSPEDMALLNEFSSYRTPCVDGECSVISDGSDAVDQSFTPAEQGLCFTSPVKSGEHAGKRNNHEYLDDIITRFNKVMGSAQPARTCIADGTISEHNSQHALGMSEREIEHLDINSNECFASEAADCQIDDCHTNKEHVEGLYNRNSLVNTDKILYRSPARNIDQLNDAGNSVQSNKIYTDNTVSSSFVYSPSHQSGHVNSLFSSSGRLKPSSDRHQRHDMLNEQVQDNSYNSGRQSAATTPRVSATAHQLVNLNQSLQRNSGRQLTTHTPRGVDENPIRDKVVSPLGLLDFDDIGDDFLVPVSPAEYS